MRTFQGTWGPWSVEYGCRHEDPVDGLFIISPIEEDGLPWHVAKVDLGTGHDDENARLMAAAPDLLAAALLDRDCNRLMEAAFQHDLPVITAIIESYPDHLHLDMAAETASYVLAGLAEAKRESAIVKALGEEASS